MTAGGATCFTVGAGVGAVGPSGLRIGITAVGLVTGCWSCWCWGCAWKDNTLGAEGASGLLMSGGPAGGGGWKAEGGSGFGADPDGGGGPIGFDERTADVGSASGNAKALIEGSAVPTMASRSAALRGAPPPFLGHALDALVDLAVLDVTEAPAQLLKLQEVDFALPQLGRLLAHLLERAVVLEEREQQAEDEPREDDPGEGRPADVLAVGLVGVREEGAAALDGDALAHDREASPELERVTVELGEHGAERRRQIANLGVPRVLVGRGRRAELGEQAGIAWSKRLSSKPWTPAPATFAPWA